MELILTEEEREFVVQVLEQRHRDMVKEISHTDHHHFKEVLKRKALVLESVLARLETHQAVLT